MECKIIIDGQEQMLPLYPGCRESDIILNIVQLCKERIKRPFTTIRHFSHDYAQKLADESRYTV